MNKNAVI